MNRHGRPGVLAPLLSLALLSLLTLPAGAQTASLVADLNTDSRSVQGRGSGPHQMLVAQDRVFFLANEPSSGDELWVTDGTAYGTEMLADICPGDCSPSLVPMGSVGRLTFWLDRRSGALWRSDGTRPGTFVLTEPDIEIRLGDRPAAVLGSVLFFTACSREHDCELWRSDGTVEGTRIAVDIQSGFVSSNPMDFVVLGGKLYFFAEIPFRGLWRSDGTEAGTSRVSALQDFSPRLLTPAGTRLFFVSDVAGGEELWMSDGTEAGTRPVTQFAPSFPIVSEWLKVMGDRVYFMANDGTHGPEIWRSDGTATGTVRLTEFGDADPFFSFDPPDLPGPVREALVDRSLPLVHDGALPGLHGRRPGQGGREAALPGG